MARPAKYILKDIDPNEFSLVPVGENGKRFFLFKSNNQGELDAMKVQEIVKSVLDRDLKDEPMLDQIMKSASLADDSQQAIKAALRLLTATEVPEDVRKSIFETAGIMPKTEPVAPEPEPEVSNVNEPGGEEMNEVFKGLELPAETAEKLEEILKGVELKANERIEKMTVELKAERDARLTKEYVAKAATFGHLGLDSGEFGVVLKELSERYPEGYDKITEVLKKADGEIGESKLFSEVGTSTANDAGIDAWSQIEKMADALVLKSEDKLSKADAINEVLKTQEGAQLYNDYDNQRLAGRV